MEETCRLAHIYRGVRIHVGVGQRCRASRDVESTALPAEKTSARNVPAGQTHFPIILRTEGSIQSIQRGEHTSPDASFLYTFELISVAVPSMRSPPPCKPKEQASGERFIGAMERYMRGFDSVQNSRCPATIHRQQ